MEVREGALIFSRGRRALLLLMFNLGPKRDGGGGGGV